MIEKIIDIEKWNRKKQFNWFNSFDNPCYNLNVRIDVTNLVNYVKSNNHSFFIDFMFAVTKGLDSIEEMRTRIVDGKVVVYSTINPTYTVMTESGTFENCEHQNSEDYTTFYNRAKEVIEKVKKQKVVKDEYNKEEYDKYYMTCIPWIDFEGLTHPIPQYKNSLNVPRVCWGKYTKKDNRYSLTLNICVSHALVDGYPLCNAFKRIQEYVDTLSIFD